MDFDNRESIIKVGKQILVELQVNEARHYDCQELATAFKAKFVNLKDIPIMDMSHRIGICLSCAYKKDPTSISRIRNEIKGKRSGGTYLYGVVNPTTTVSV